MPRFFFISIFVIGEQIPHLLVKRVIHSLYADVFVDLEISLDSFADKLLLEPDYFLVKFQMISTRRRYSRATMHFWMKKVEMILEDTALEDEIVRIGKLLCAICIIVGELDHEIIRVEARHAQDKTAFG